MALDARRVLSLIFNQTGKLPSGPPQRFGGAGRANPARNLNGWNRLAVNGFDSERLCLRGKDDGVNGNIVWHPGQTLMPLAVCTRQSGVLLSGLDCSKKDGARLDAEASSKGGMTKPAGNVAWRRMIVPACLSSSGPTCGMVKGRRENPENVIVPVALEDPVA